ncbi:hypothetical protein KAU45_09165 [bacterium]|nr:hypothetical protein [bacterium]
MIRIKFHSHLNLRFANAMVKRCNQFACAEDEVTLDFQHVLSIKPFALSLIYNSMLKYFENHTVFNIDLPRSKSARAYLDNFGLYKTVERGNTYGTTFQLTPITENYAQKVLGYIDIIKVYEPNINKDIHFIIRLCMQELALNVVDHSNSPFGCVVCGQIYHKREEIHVSISDYGIGFLNSLKTIRPDLKNDANAIITAVEEHVTTRKDAPGGQGLGHIIIGVLGVYGSVTFLSGHGMVTYYKKNNGIEKEVKEMNSYQQGVSINIVLPLLHKGEQTLFQEIIDD